MSIHGFTDVAPEEFVERLAGELCNTFYDRDLWNNPGVLPDELDRDLWRRMASMATRATMEALARMKEAA